MDIYNIPLHEGVGDEGARTLVVLDKATIEELQQVNPDAIPRTLKDAAFAYLIENPTTEIDPTLVVEPRTVQGVGGLEGVITKAANDAHLFNVSPAEHPIREALLARHGLMRKGEVK